MSKNPTDRPASICAPEMSVNSIEELLNLAHRALTLQARFFSALANDDANERYLSDDECSALEEQTRAIAGLIKPVIASLGHPEFSSDFRPFLPGGAR